MLETIVLLFVIILGFFFIYSRLSASIRRRFEVDYQNLIRKDIYEFYREMESYAALLENRISRYKKLVLRFEKTLHEWEKVSEGLKKSRRGKEIELLLKHLRQEIQPLQMDKTPRTLEKISEPNFEPIKSEMSSDKNQIKTPSHSFKKQKQEKKPNLHATLSMAELVLEDYLEKNPDKLSSEINQSKADFSDTKQKKTTFGFTSVLSNVGSQIRKSFTSPDASPPPILNSSVEAKEFTFNSAIESATKIQQENISKSEKLINKKDSLLDLKNQFKTSNQEKINTNFTDLIESNINSQAKRIESDTLMDWVNQMKDSKTRKNVIPLMLEHGFRLFDISELTGISMGELKTICTVYEIDDKE